MRSLYLSRHPALGWSNIAWQKIWRLAGADHMHVNGIGNKFAETDESGSYKIKDVPDGSYTLAVWHEGAKNQSKPVTVSGGAKADFMLTK